MRALNETEKYLNSIEKQEEVKEKQSMEDILGKVVETFSSMESAVKDLEEVIKSINISNEQPNEEPIKEEEKENGEQ